MFLYYEIYHVYGRWLTCTALELALLMAVKFAVQEMHGFALRYVYISEIILWLEDHVNMIMFWTKYSQKFSSH